MKINKSDLIKNQPDKNIGIIGHVAHGKSTIAFQISGKKTQQHSSEKEKNITINIGYANAKIFIDCNLQLHIAPSKTDELKDDS